MSRALSEATADALRALARTISELPIYAPGEWVTIKPAAARVYVWAVYEGRDPVAALGRWMFGAEHPLFDADPAWLDPERRKGSRTYWAVVRAEAIAGLRLNIPVAERVAA